MFGVERPGGQPADGAGDGGPSGARLNGADTHGNAKGAASGNRAAAGNGKPADSGKAADGGKVTDGGKATGNGAADRPADSTGFDGSARPDSTGADGSARPDSTGADGSASPYRSSGSANSGDGGDGTQTDTGHKPSRRAIAIGVAAVCVVGAGAGYALSQLGGSTPTSGTPTSGAPVTNSPIRVVSVTPAAGATHVDGANAVTVTFNEPVSSNSPHPVLQPSVPGAWTAQGNSLVFTPTTAFPPSSRETVDIPAGAAGVRSAGGRRLKKAMTAQFTTEPYSQGRLAQLLGELGYLPLRFSSQVTGVGRIEVPQAAAAQQDNSQQALAYNPPPGSFSWTQTYPSTLTSQWSPSGANVLVRGAVMAFQSQHRMTINGNVTTRLWNALFAAMQRHDGNKNGYTYAVANKGSPETLTIWHNGRQVLRSLANTGIPVSPTVDGTFPVYLRLRFQIMQGTNPDGSSYADPVSFVSYFNGGDAVHYFPRGSYGFQQSLGCVELPYNDAERAYPYLTYGSLVTVDG